MKDVASMTEQELDAFLMQQDQRQKSPEEMTEAELDAFLMQNPELPEPQSVTPEQAALSGFGEAATLGYLPQLQAMGEQAMQYLMPKDEATKQLEAQGFTVEEQQPTYVESRDAFARQLEAQKQARPTAFTAGQVGGALSTALIPGGQIAKGAGMAQKLGQAAKTGAAFGALQATDIKEGEGPSLDLEERAKNALLGAATGAATGATIEAIGKAAGALKRTPQTLKNYAELKSFKSSGAMLKDFRKAFGNRKANELGRTMLDKNIVQYGDDVASIAKRTETAKNAIGEQIGNIYSNADDIIANIDQIPMTPSQQRLVNKTNLNMDLFAKVYKRDMQKRLSGLGGKRAILSRVSKELDEIAQNGVVDLKRLQDIRRSIDDQINFSKATQELPGVQREFMNLRNKIQDIAKDRLRAVDKLTGQNNVKAINEANKQFSNLSEINAIAQDKFARESANAAFGLRERISGGVGATVGGMVGGVPGAVAGGVLGSITTKLARQYGTPFVARSANRAAKILEKNPNMLGKFAEPLIEAAQQNPEVFVKTVENLLNEPEFKRKVGKSFGK